MKIVVAIGVIAAILIGCGNGFFMGAGGGSNGGGYAKGTSPAAPSTPPLVPSPTSVPILSPPASKGKSPCTPPSVCGALYSGIAGSGLLYKVYGFSSSQQLFSPSRIVPCPDGAGVSRYTVTYQLHDDSLIIVSEHNLLDFTRVYSPNGSSQFAPSSNPKKLFVTEEQCNDIKSFLKKVSFEHFVTLKDSGDYVGADNTDKCLHINPTRVSFGHLSDWTDTDDNYYCFIDLDLHYQ